ncbi:MAG: iron ABC transporter substrate-binding protein, partial [Spirochaetaceae bacterium]|nr:iron ABC transporter substrate-binding protein [Spirochaetaceae bacterium]
MTRPRRRAAGLLAALLSAGLAAGFASCGVRRAAAPAAEAAQGEPDLVVYSSHPEELVRIVVAEFRDRTGLSVRLVQGGTGELL